MPNNPYDTYYTLLHVMTNYDKPFLGTFTDFLELSPWANFPLNSFFLHRYETLGYQPYKKYQGENNIY